MIWNRAMIRYVAILGFIGMVAAATLAITNAHEIKQQVNTAYSSAKTCIDAAKITRDTTSNLAKTTYATAGPIAKYVDYIRSIFAAQVDGALGELDIAVTGHTNRGELKGSTPEQTKKLQDASNSLGRFIDPIAECSQTLQSLQRPKG
ncbi:hypothetical protein PuT2_11975 [Pusillimonas sp. T2]|uniref:hypothetical protein n=1 Tax=Pusillimonas sp. T2 TaxID=1548123 RepID=UPI000B9D4617|nr:hypothetical protein [Pusillimonas sp. T2]OXR48678.1 hypothetical protein PuT2_11975 [Pusillimonas sp. T2]